MASLRLNIQAQRLRVGFQDADGYERIWVSDPRRAPHEGSRLFNGGPPLAE